MEEKIYVVNGKRYSSTNEIPPEDASLSKNESITFDINDPKTDKKITIIAPLSGKASQLRLIIVKYFIYGLTQTVSLLESLFVGSIPALFSAPKVPILVSILMGLIIGHISYSLAPRLIAMNQIKVTDNAVIDKGVEVKFSDNIAFLKDFPILITSSIIAGILNGTFDTVFTFIRLVFLPR